MKEIITLQIVDEKSINEAILTIREYCVQLGFDTLNVNLILSAVSEIATNVVKYGLEGSSTISELSSGKGIEIKVEDKGSGVENIERALEDGYSTAPSSLGIGLGVAKRAMDYFHIESKKNAGTIVKMEKWLPVKKSSIEYAAISLPDPNYIYNGDGYVFQEYNGNSLFAGIIDGLGEGINAWRTTESLKKILQENYMLDKEVLIKKCETKIKESQRESGAAVGLLKISPDRMSYVGVGDTFIKIYAHKSKQIISQSGVVGAFELPSLKKKTVQIDFDTTVILCTDGIQDRMTKQSLPLEMSPHEIAKYIFDNYRRINGDATVLVIKIRMDL